MSSANYLMFGVAMLWIARKTNGMFLEGRRGASLSSLQFLEKKKLFFFNLKVLLVNGGQNLISDSVTPPCASDFSWHCTDYPCTKSPLWLTCQRAWSIFCLSENDISSPPPPFFFFITWTLVLKPQHAKAPCEVGKGIQHLLISPNWSTSVPKKACI